MKSFENLSYEEITKILFTKGSVVLVEDGILCDASITVCTGRKFDPGLSKVKYDKDQPEVIDDLIITSWWLGGEKYFTDADKKRIWLL